MLDRDGITLMVTDDPIPHASEIQLFTAAEPRRGLCRYFPFPPATRAELWGGVVMIALSLLGAIWVLKCRVEALALEQDSEIVEGTVVRLRVTKDVKNRPHYWTEYDGPLDLQTVILRREVELPKDHFDRLKERGTVPLENLPHGPRQSPVCRRASATFSEYWGHAVVPDCSGAVGACRSH
jgi:hypothetical protein